MLYCNGIRFEGTWVHNAKHGCGTLHTHTSDVPYNEVYDHGICIQSNRPTVGTIFTLTNEGIMVISNTLISFALKAGFETGDLLVELDS